MKKRQVVTYIVVMLALICTSVYATISGDISLSMSKDKVQKGEEFSVTLSMKDIQTTEGVKAVEGYININENILEDLTIESIVTKDGKVEINKDNILEVSNKVESNGTSSSEAGIIFNDDPVSGKGDYRIVINFAKEITTDADLVTINFKVKDTVENGSYDDAIEYTIFRIFSDNEKVSIEDKDIQLIVETSAPAQDDNTNQEPDEDQNTNKDDEQDKNEDTNKDDEQNKNENTNKDDEQDKNENTNKDDEQNKNEDANKDKEQDKNSNDDNTVATLPLPDTGYKFVLIPLIVVAIVGIIFYKKYMKYNNIK